VPGAGDDAPTRRERRREPCLDVLAGDRQVDVHGMAQRLGIIEVLHPDRLSVAERVDGVVIVKGRVTERGTPEPDVQLVRLRRDRQLHLLYGVAVRDSARSARTPGCSSKTPRRRFAPSA